MLKLVRAELRCYHCGYVAARLEGDSGLPLQQAHLLSPPNGPGYRHGSGGSLRCGRCDGPLYVDSVETFRRQPIDSSDLSFRPRRGRPRKPRAA